MTYILVKVSILVLMEVSFRLLVRLEGIAWDILVSILVLMEVSFRQQVVSNEKETVYIWFQSLF